MRNFFLGFFLCLTSCSFFSACAGPKKSAGVKSGTTYAKLIEATMQRTLPGAPGMEPQDEYRFLVVWKSNQYPETFFWRGGEVWLPCGIARAHRNPKRDPDELWYSLEEVKLNNIKKGDTLELMPKGGGKYVIPSEIPASLRSSIFFKTTKSGWQYIPAKNIHRKNDIIMP